MASRYTIRLKGKKSYDRFVWTTAEAEAIFGVSQKFNPNHYPEGDEKGGQFAFAPLGWSVGVHKVTDGSATIIYDVFDEGRFVDLINLTVPLDERGQGFAKRLLARFTFVADANKAKIAVLAQPKDAHTDPKKLIKLFAEQGFQLSGGKDVHGHALMERTPQKQIDTLPESDHMLPGVAAELSQWHDILDDAYESMTRFNPFHVPAGSEHGGEFTSADAAGVIIATDRLGNKVEVTENSSLGRHLIKRADGSWGLDPQRELLHQQIVNQMLDGIKRQDGPLSLYMTGGGPASGKSTILVGDILPPAGEAVMVNPDIIKELLPEYSVMVAAGDRMAGTYVHEESSLIRKRLERAAIAGNYNVVLDTTGDSSVKKLAESLSAYRAAGYTIKAYYASNDVDLAVKLAEARGHKQGRFVPESVLRSAHENVSLTFPKAVMKGLFDEVSLYDTNIQGKPRLVATGTRTDFNVHDQALYHQFLAKGTGGAGDINRKRAAGDFRVETDMLEKMVVAITLGRPKPHGLKPQASTLWDQIAAEIALCPEGQWVDPGDELSRVDLTNLYSDEETSAKTAGQIENTQWVTIKRIDGDKQIVYGEVYAPLVLDTYGEFMTADDIETMAHRFMRLDLSKVIDTQHDNQPNGSYPVESFVARDGDPHYTPGAWVLGVHVPDASLWHAVKNGKLNGFSFQCLVKPTDVDVEINAIRDFVGETELQNDHSHTFFVELNDIGNVVKGRTSAAKDGHTHEITFASVTSQAAGHSHRFFL